jgi:hypothetical protein
MRRNELSGGDRVRRAPRGARCWSSGRRRGYAICLAATDRRTEAQSPSCGRWSIQISEGRETLDYVYAVTLLETLRDHRPANPKPGTPNRLGTEPGTQEPGTSEP